MPNFTIANKIELANPHANLDVLYGPYNSLAEAKATVVSVLREKGLTVGVYESGAVVEYWWKAGTTDADLVLKQASVAGVMLEADYTGDGTAQVNYSKYADEAEQAIHAYSAQQDALGREIHTTYALKDSGITPPETETITLTNASPVYTVTNATAPALIVLNNATTGGEIYLSGELEADKSITIQVFGNDTLISSHSGSNTYQDEDTVFASFEVATASWFVTDTETTIIPDYSDMIVDTMLVDPAITPKPGYIYIAGDVFTINTIVFIKSTSTPTQTGIYKVFSTGSGGSNMYLIAAGTALHTVRVKDGDVWYSQYDGKNQTSLIFKRVIMSAYPHVTLFRADWDPNNLRQTVNVNGLIETSKIFVYPDTERNNYLEYAACQVSAVSKTTTSVTFQTSLIPDSDLTLTIEIRN